MIRRSMLVPAFVAALALAGPLVGTARTATPTPPGQGGATPSVAVTVRAGIQYTVAAGQIQLLDAYLPQGTGPFAAVILVHGGGWEHGDRSNLAEEARYLAGNGFVAFSIDYRRANPTGAHYNPYPAAVEDVQTAIRWVRSHAADYHVDPHRLGLLGSSAGAQLASLVGMLGKGPLDAGDRVRAVVSWSGPQDMAEVLQDGPLRAQEAIKAFLDCQDATSCGSKLTEASPITYVDPSDPPLFFSNGTDELVPLPQANEMDQALSAAGVQHKLVVVPGRLHAQHYKDMTSPDLPAGQTVEQASLAWFKEWLNGQASPSATVAPTTPSRPKKSNGLLPVMLGAGILVVVGFAAWGASGALRRRARRARREKEWKAGQRRSRSGSHSGSRGSRSGSRDPV
jgi:acetyl esterase/lipase